METEVECSSPSGGRGRDEGDRGGVPREPKDTSSYDRGSEKGRKTKDLGLVSGERKFPSEDKRRLGLVPNFLVLCSDACFQNSEGVTSLGTRDQGSTRGTPVGDPFSDESSVSGTCRTGSSILSGPRVGPDLGSFVSTEGDRDGQTNPTSSRYSSGKGRRSPRSWTHSSTPAGPGEYGRLPVGVRKPVGT